MLKTIGTGPRLLALALVIVLTAALGGWVTRPATAAPSQAPAEIQLVAISSTTAAPAGTPPAAWPNVLAVADQTLTVTVRFLDSSGQSTSFAKDTRLVVTSNQGTVRNIDTIARRGDTTSFLRVSIPAAANQVRLTVAVAGGKLPLVVTAGDAQRFDVVSQLRFENSETDFQKGIGGDNNCETATPAAPVCGILMLPQGASSEKILLSLGPCGTSSYSGCGNPLGSVVQAIVGLDGYSRTSPATVLIKCDKTLCEGGAIQSKQLSFTRFGNEPLTTAAACPAKGTVGAFPQVACVDYVQSRRDGSGDTHLYLLFVQDARISVG